MKQGGQVVEKDGMVRSRRPLIRTLASQVATHLNAVIQLADVRRQSTSRQHVFFGLQLRQAARIKRGTIGGMKNVCIQLARPQRYTSRSVGDKTPGYNGEPVRHKGLS